MSKTDPSTQAGRDVVAALNEKFGTRYDDVDALLFQAFITAAASDPIIREGFAAGDAEGMERVREGLSAIIREVQKQHARLFERIVTGGDFARLARDRLAESIYNSIRAA